MAPEIVNSFEIRDLQIEEHVDKPICVSRSNKRFTLLPIKYPELWASYKKAQASIWTAEEIDLSADYKDWILLTEGERHFLSHVLAFFSGSDAILVENLAARFINDVEAPEARAFYAFQMANEQVHSETYALLSDTYIKDPTERERLFNAIDTIPCVAQKADWAKKWIGSDRSFGERLVAFAAVEGIFFSGSFCAIFFFKKRGLLPGLCFSNELIARDEGGHRDFACQMLDHADRLEFQKPNESTIHAIIKEAVTIEKQFVCDSLPCALLGMNADAMSQYIEYVADHLLATMGINKIYFVDCPFDFMENLSLQRKVNFFENRVSEYQKSNVMHDAAANHTFSMEEEF